MSPEKRQKWTESFAKTLFLLVPHAWDTSGQMTTLQISVHISIKNLWCRKCRCLLLRGIHLHQKITFSSLENPSCLRKERKSKCWPLVPHSPLHTWLVCNQSHFFFFIACECNEFPLVMDGKTYSTGTVYRA